TGRIASAPVLLPVTDFLNHQWRGEPYSYDEDRAVAMDRSAPLPGAGDQCFAMYGFHDAFDTWITYGFVEADVPFLQSVATTVELPRAGTIRIGDVAIPRAGDDTEASAENLQSYVPRILGRKTGRLTAAAVIIPGPQAPRALRRTLRSLIAELGAPA